MLILPVNKTQIITLRIMDDGVAVTGLSPSGSLRAMYNHDDTPYLQVIGVSTPTWSASRLLNALTERTGGTDADDGVYEIVCSGDCVIPEGHYRFDCVVSVNGYDRTYTEDIQVTSSSAYTAPLITASLPGHFVGNPQHLAMHEGEEKVFSFSSSDATGGSFDFSTVDLAFHVETTATPPVRKLTLTSPPVVGDGAGVQLDLAGVTRTQLPSGTYNWQLWDTTNSITLINGTLEVLPTSTSS